VKFPVGPMPQKHKKLLRHRYYHFNCCFFVQHNNFLLQVTGLKLGHGGNGAAAATTEPVNNGSGDAPAVAPVVSAPGSTTSSKDEPVSHAEQSIIQKILRTRLVESSKEHLEVIRKDPTSPLYSAKTFEELNL
jgi:hypothetical protein